MRLDPAWTQRACSPEEVVSHVRSGMNVFIHGACATPAPLLEALSARTDLEKVELWHLHLAGKAPWLEPDKLKSFHSNSLFNGPNLRAAVNDGRADFIPIFLSDVPLLFKRGHVPLDVAVVQLSYPDEHGYCTLGTSVDAAMAAVVHAKLVVAEINRQMPRTLGNTHVHLSQLHAFTITDRPLLEHEPSVLSEVEVAIGKVVAEIIPDGATLQMGIGGIPDAVLAQLMNKQDLGIHTEMFSDLVVDLAAAGVITNRFKTVKPGRIVTSFINGSKKLLDFVDNNPFVAFHPCDYTNDTAVVRQIDNMVAINSAIEVDLTGQVCADSIGTRIYSGIGGQMDFIRGAALSRGGKPIIAISSTVKKTGAPRIVPVLKPGAGVVTTRGHVHWVATEYGIVNLHGLSLRRRGEALISIAHPDHRAELMMTLKEQRHFLVGATPSV